MLRKFIVIAFVIGLGSMLQGQETTASLNNYKYVIVPSKFDFFKETDKYQLNSLTKFLFEKYGFAAFLDTDDLPADYKRNNCLAMQSDVLEDKGFFKTKLTVELKNCQGEVIYTSRMGETREKEFKAAYQTALRDAFKSFETVNYKYVPKDEMDVIAVEQEVAAKDETKQEIEKLKAEIEQLKADSKPVENAIPIAEVAIVEVPVVAVQSNQDKAPKTDSDSKVEVLYAQPTDDGFQLVDSTPKIVYKLKKTGSDAMYLVESINGVLTKKGNDWVLEYYDKGNLVQKVLSIKF